MRHLDEVRHEHKRPEHREAGDQRGDVREKDLAPGQHAHVDHWLVDVELGDAPREQQDDRGGGEAERALRGPAPALAFGERDEHRDQAAGHERRT